MPCVPENGEVTLQHSENFCGLTCLVSERGPQIHDSICLFHLKIDPEMFFVCVCLFCLCFFSERKVYFCSLKAEFKPGVEGREDVYCILQRRGLIFLEFSGSLFAFSLY